MYLKSRCLGSIVIQIMLTFTIPLIVFGTSTVILFALQKNSRIAFIKERDVCVMDEDGSSAQQLTSLGSYKSATLPAWAPDDEEIVFTVTFDDAPAQVWVMHSDGTHQRVLVSDRFLDNTAANFSPDGRTVVFARCLQPQASSSTSECAIFRVQTDSSGLTAVTESQSAVRDFNPVYSPDGKTLAFESYNRQGVAGAIYLMDADGSNIRRLTPPDIGARAPSWSPDGLKIAFSSNCCTGRNSDIWVIGRDGRGLTGITNSCVQDCGDWGYLNSFPSWSPDGGAIAFGQAMVTPARGIWAVDAGGAGKNQRFAALIRPDGIQPRWSHAK
jgi:Tol biopolymer transport system component